MDPIKVYKDFKKFREELIERFLDRADFTDEKDGHRVRPLIICKSEHEYLELKALVDKWHEMAEMLCNADPVRFKPKAKIFKPAPTLLKDVYHVKLREMHASSGKKVEKSSLVKRMQIATEAAKEQGKLMLAETLENETQAMIEDGEEFYYRRAQGYVEYRALCYMDKIENDTTKYSLNYSGLIILPAKDARKPFFAGLEDVGDHKPRSGKIENSGIKPVRCSLPSRCQFYKYSEYLTVKGKSPKTS